MFSPYSQPCFDRSLLGKLLDVCGGYDVDKGGTELMWSQREVNLVSNVYNIKNQVQEVHVLSH